MEGKQREFLYTRKDFNFLRTIANDRTGIVVGDDKYDMYYSRLSRRVRKLGLSSFKDYCDLLRNVGMQHEESTELVNAITTNLTSFFREKHHFSYLKDTAIPELLKKNKSSRRLRIWSAGCSTGEEPYSLSIILNESKHLLSGWDTRILATDIDSNVLAKASKGIYPNEAVKGLDKAVLRSWFQRGKGGQDGSVKLKADVQKKISFGQLNLMDNWSLDEPQDIIFCRNVIIYFDKPTKAKLIDRYADVLKPGGYLFIGHSESLYKTSDRFDLIGNTIYQKKD